MLCMILTHSLANGVLHRFGENASRNDLIFDHHSGCPCSHLQEGFHVHGSHYRR